MILFVDTETTGLPKRWDAPLDRLENWPRLVQIGWLLTSPAGGIVAEGCELIKPADFEIPDDAIDVHGITTQRALSEGIELSDAVAALTDQLALARTVVAHNIAFDSSVLGAEYLRLGIENLLLNCRQRCTMRESTFYCRIPCRYGLKWPTLAELYFMLFRRRLYNSHDALVDCRACMACFFELRRKGVL